MTNVLKFSIALPINVLPRLLTLTYYFHGQQKESSQYIVIIYLIAFCG